jgi:hypothetical protein
VDPARVNDQEVEEGRPDWWMVTGYFEGVVEALGAGEPERWKPGMTFAKPRPTTISAITMTTTTTVAHRWLPGGVADEEGGLGSVGVGAGGDTVPLGSVAIGCFWEPQGGGADGETEAATLVNGYA